MALSPSPSDEDLAERLRHRDRNALTFLYQRYHHRLFNFSLRITGNRAIAEELLQETFLRLAESRRGYRRTASFRTYLYTIARNLCLDVLKSPGWRDRPPRGQPEGDTPGHADFSRNADQNPHAALEARERAEGVRAALIALPTLDREVLVLSRYEACADELAGLRGAWQALGGWEDEVAAPHLLRSIEARWTMAPVAARAVFHPWVVGLTALAAALLSIGNSLVMPYERVFALCAAVLRSLTVSSVERMVQALRKFGYDARPVWIMSFSRCWRSSSSSSGTAICSGGAVTEVKRASCAVGDEMVILPGDVKPGDIIECHGVKQRVSYEFGAYALERVK